MYIEYIENARVLEAKIDTDTDGKLGIIDTAFLFEGFYEGNVNLTLLIPEGTCVYSEKIAYSERIERRIKIENPKLWYPNGMGEQPLYTLVLSYGEEKYEYKVGIRKLRYLKNPGSPNDALTYTIEINGKSVYIRGNNKVPLDHLYGNVSYEDYEWCVRAMANENVNLVRVWGGGIIETETFYDLCDKYGILIWQDFMFACAPYPHDPLFLQRVEAEAKYNIRRLRNHACLALWCGNNEIFEALRFWSWRQRLSPEMYEEKKKGYKILFEDLLAKAVEKWDGERFYMQSSPYFSRWDQPETFNIGDSHHWGVWAGKKPFRSGGSSFYE